jgi:Ca2+-binding RTX toxin-like protein
MKAPLHAAVALTLITGGLLAAAPAYAATRAACPVRATIYGTAGNDLIVGTPGNDVICAGSGNDTIIGKGGADQIYGGPGNDGITTGAGADTIFGGSGADLIDAGAGDDLIFGDNPTTLLRDPTDNGADGADVIYGGLGSESIDGGGGNDIIFTGGVGGPKPAIGTNIVHGGPGNDVIMSDFRYPGGFEYFYGDAGSDLLWPNPLRLNPLGNVAVGGTGNDVIILLNFAMDGAHMGDLSTSVTFPLGGLCGITVPLPGDPKPGDTGKLSCKLPVNVKIPGLINGLNLNLSVNANGKVTATVSVKPSGALAALNTWQTMAKGGFPAEVCVCDPKLPGWAALFGDTVYK